MSVKKVRIAGASNRGPRASVGFTRFSIGDEEAENEAHRRRNVRYW